MGGREGGGGGHEGGRGVREGGRQGGEGSEAMDRVHRDNVILQNVGESSNECLEKSNYILKIFK